MYRSPATLMGATRGAATVLLGLAAGFASAATWADDAPPVTIARGDALTIVAGPAAGTAGKRAAELLAEVVKARSGIEWRIVGTAGGAAAIILAVEPAPQTAALPADGYRIDCDAATKRWTVTGATPSGLVAGVGRLMRSIRFENDRVAVPTTPVADAPRMPNRGMYLWARKHYFNQPDQVERYIEEFALRGGNAVAFWFEMGMFESLEDTSGEKSELNSGYARQYQLDKTVAKDWITLYRRLYATARRLGMKTGLIMVVNDAYMSSPQELRISPIIGCPEWYLCPSRPGAVEKMVAWQEEVFRALGPIDIFNMFPADAGGCSCQECTPWPTRGYWRIARPLAERIHEISPQTQIWIDTWHLNHPTFGGKDWKNLVDSLDWNKERPKWFTGFEVALAPHHGYARMSADERDYYNRAK